MEGYHKHNSNLSILQLWLMSCEYIASSMYTLLRAVDCTQNILPTSIQGVLMLVIL